MTLVTEKYEYVTLQNVGYEYYPLSILRHDKIIKSFNEIEYQLIDE